MVLPVPNHFQIIFVGLYTGICPTELTSVTLSYPWSDEMILGASHCPRRDRVRYCWFSWPPRHDLTCLFLFDFPECRRLPPPDMLDEMFWPYRRLCELPCWFRLCNMHGNGFVRARRSTISMFVDFQWCCFWVSARACVRFSLTRKFDFIFCQ